MSAVASLPEQGRKFITEVAVYTVRNPEDYPAICDKALDRVMESPHILGGLQLRSAKNNRLFADVYFWTDLEAAKAVADQVERDDDYAEFRNSFDKMHLFTHYETDARFNQLVDYLADQAVVEIAACTVRDRRARSRLQPVVYGRLSQEADCLGAIAMTPFVEADGYVDFIAWRSGDAAERTTARLMQNEETKPFFENVDEMKVFEMFHVYGQKGLK